MKISNFILGLKLIEDYIIDEQLFGVSTMGNSNDNYFIIASENLNGPLQIELEKLGWEVVVFNNRAAMGCFLNKFDEQNHKFIVYEGEQNV